MHPYPPWLDGHFDLYRPEWFPEAIDSLITWEMELAGNSPLAKEPRYKKHRVSKLLRRLWSELGSTDPYAIPLIF
jgi:hypothetical protein